MKALARWSPFGATVAALLFAWINFLTTARWAAQPGALHGWRKPWYALALIVTTLLVLAARRHIGQSVRVGRPAALLLLAGGAGVLVTSLLCRLPPWTWTQIPFKDDWTPLFQQAVNGATLLRRGVVVGWNWWFLGGYPTSTDIAQNFGMLALLPMTVFGDRLGYHLLHVVLFLAVPLFIWWDFRDEDREIRVVGTAFAASSRRVISGRSDRAAIRTPWSVCSAPASR